jgi:hypothetical protein
LLLPPVWLPQTQIPATLLVDAALVVASNLPVSCGEVAALFLHAIRDILPIPLLCI